MTTASTTHEQTHLRHNSIPRIPHRKRHNNGYAPSSYSSGVSTEIPPNSMCQRHNRSSILRDDPDHIGHLSYRSDQNYAGTTKASTTHEQTRLRRNVTSQIPHREYHNHGYTPNSNSNCVSAETPPHNTCQHHSRSSIPRDDLDYIGHQSY